ncbi:MAG: biotin--[acetyl-CoA-carboxylase] ligase [Rhodocyclaceae bacterium]|nr:biotin--[acetyl-CoA-carboxylase] ligase [Rhodocyclaceae bacterium]
MADKDHQFEQLDAAVVNAALGALAPSFRVDVLDTCESTSTLLLDRAPLGAPSGSVIACERQTAGRGRRGRSWLSAPGDSLTFSLYWRFPAGTPLLAGLSLAVGVAVARTLEKNGAAGIRLKWPNDILAADGKLGGILVETMTGGGTQAAVIGIGLNVRLPRAIAEAVGIQAADLSSVMPFAPSRNLLLAGVLAELAVMLDEFARSGFAAFIEEWLSRHAYTGRTVRILADGAQPVEGRCAGVDADGALLLETAAGMKRIVSGEVSLRTANP